jgi:hypothetical protein
VKSRLEPLLWLQCLALGAIPLELLLIRLILAGADPGPVPPIERLLIWAIGVLAPAAALWKRPADWGSLLLVRVPLKERDQDQQALSAKPGGLISRTSVVVAALGSLPLLWWLDDSAVLASEFSPVLGQSRLVTLLISIPVLALMVWQVQQISQALGWLLPIRREPDQEASAENTAEHNSLATDQQHTSFGLQILRLNRLVWPEPAAKPIPEPPPASEAVSAEPVPTEDDPFIADAADQGRTKPTDSSNDPEEYRQPNVDESKSFEDKALENHGLEENDTETNPSEVNINEASVEQLKDDEACKDEPDNHEGNIRAGEREITMDAESVLETDPPEVAKQQQEDSVGAFRAVDVKEDSEQGESPGLDPEVTELNSITRGNAEEHGEQTKSGGSEQGTPNEPPEATPRGE